MLQEITLNVYIRRTLTCARLTTIVQRVVHIHTSDPLAALAIARRVFADYDEHFI